jgi:drug/metabolite transporter (DMT)-like permease
VPDRVLHRPPTADLIALAVAVAAASTSAPVIRQAGVATMAVAAWRNVLGAGVFVPLVALRRPIRAELRATTARQRRLAVLAGVLLGAHFATWIPSLSYTSVASSVALVATQPVWAAVLARLRGQPVGATAWTGILVAVAGAVTLSGFDWSTSARALLGDVLALVGGALAAAYVTVGAHARATVGTAVFTALAWTTAAVGLVAACLVGGVSLWGYSGRSWLYLAALTVGAQLLGHAVFGRVLRTTSPTVVSVAILGEVVGATLLAWAWFGERPPGAVVPAGVLIAVGVVTVVRSGGTPRAEAGPAAAERAGPGTPGENARRVRADGDPARVDRPPR